MWKSSTSRAGPQILRQSLILAVVLSASLFATQAAAQPDDVCKSKKSIPDRLACLDKRSAAVEAKRSDERYKFAKRIERALLSAGVSMTVTVLDDTKLLFMRDEGGSFAKATVYQIMTGGDLLNTAKPLGFKTIEFLSRHEVYTFDLTAREPRCAVRGILCLR